RRARIGRAVLRDRLLLLGDFERLDGDGDLARLAIELGDARIDLFADREALGPLVAAIARELVALDEGGELGARNLHLEAAVLDLDDLAGDDRALAHFAFALFADLRRRKRVTGQLLDANGDALLLDINVEHLGFDLVAFLEVLDRLLAGPVPVEIGKMDHAIDIRVETNEQSELGLVLDLALDDRADRMLLRESLPRVLQRLLETERDAALGGVDLEDLHFDLLAGRDDLAG